MEGGLVAGTERGCDVWLPFTPRSLHMCMSVIVFQVKTDDVCIIFYIFSGAG